MVNALTKLEKIELVVDEIRWFWTRASYYSEIGRKVDDGWTDFWICERYLAEGDSLHSQVLYRLYLFDDSRS